MENLQLKVKKRVRLAASILRARTWWPINRSGGLGGDVCGGVVGGGLDRYTEVKMSRSAQNFAGCNQEKGTTTAGRT